jgi:hypothetical protein
MDGDRAVAELELTDDVADHGRGMGSRQRKSVGMWNQGIWKAVNVARRKRRVLNHVMATVEFSADPPRDPDAEALARTIADEASMLMEQLVRRENMLGTYQRVARNQAAAIGRSGRRDTTRPDRRPRRGPLGRPLSASCAGTTAAGGGSTRPWF